MRRISYHFTKGEQMRVLLIQPTTTIMSNRKEAKCCLPPLGLAYIAGYLRDKGHEVKIYDCQAEGYDEEFTVRDVIVYGTLGFWDLIEEFKPQFVGVSCMMSIRHYDAIGILQMIKSRYPHIITVIGGNHPSSLPDKVLFQASGLIDCLVIGEGEHAFERIINGERGIIYGDHPNIDTLSLPAHDLLPLDKYKEIWEKTNYHFYKPVKFTIMNTSRGCANRCEHCPHEVVFGKGWRRRSIHELEREVEFVKTLGVEEIQFHEYNGFQSKQYMKEVAAVMKKYGMRWNVPIGVWIKVLDEEFIHYLADSGMNCIDLALESPSKKILDTMPGKDVDVKHAENVIKWCREAGLFINVFFMIGFPDQTLEEMWNTVFYATTLDIDTCVFFIAQPLPKTKFWDKVEFIDHFEPSMLRYGKCNIKSPLWKAEDVEFIRHMGRKIFNDCKKK